MYRFYLIAIFYFCFVPMMGQKSKVLNYTTNDAKPYHFGFCLGVNTMDFIIKNSSNTIAKNALIADISSSNPGFHIQIVSNFRLGEYTDLRFLPGISFGQRDFLFFRNDTIVNNYHKLESNYLEFPLLLKYKGMRINNVRPYVIAGPNFRIDLAKTFSEDDEVYMDLKQFDLYSELGVGMDFYLPYFKLTAEFKYSYGFFNMIDRRVTTHPEYQDAIQKLNSSIFLFSLHFE